MWCSYVNDFMRFTAFIENTVNGFNAFNLTLLKNHLRTSRQFEWSSHVYDGLEFYMWNIQHQTTSEFSCICTLSCVCVWSSRARHLYRTSISSGHLCLFFDRPKLSYGISMFCDGKSFFVFLFVYRFLITHHRSMDDRVKFHRQFASNIFLWSNVREMNGKNIHESINKTKWYRRTCATQLNSCNGSPKFGNIYDSMATIKMQKIYLRRQSPH